MSAGQDWELGAFGGIATFARLPHRPDPAGADVAVVGVPYDSATTFRSGARFGPRGIRAASQVLRPYNSAMDVEPFAVLEVVDAGDVPVAPAYVEETQERIATVVGRLLDAVGVVVALGGDHSVSLRLLRAGLLRGVPRFRTGSLFRVRLGDGGPVEVTYVDRSELKVPGLAGDRGAVPRRPGAR